MVVPTMSYLKYSIVLCTFFFILPSNRKSRLLLMYIAIMFLLWLGGALFSIYGKWFLIETIPNFMVLRIMDGVKCVMGIIVGCVATIQLTFIYPQKLKYIFTSFANFDTDISQTRMRLRKYFWLCFVFSNITAILFLIMKQMCWLNNPLYRFYYIDDFTYLRVDMGVFLYFWLGIELCHRFRHLNKLLKVIPESTQKIRILLKGYTIKVSSVEPVTIGRLQEISRLHNDICDILQSMNEVFGPFILCYILYIGSYMVDKLLKVIWYTSFEYRPMMWIDTSSLLWIYGFALVRDFARVLAIAAVGTYLRKEASNTTAICYKSIHSMRHDETRRAQVLTEELRHLADQVVHRKPFLSAAGFFVIDFTIMGSIAYSITSYIIVALQFLRDD